MLVFYLLRRIGVLCTMLFGLLCITFVIANVAPGDPAALAAGPNANPSMIETIRREYGLDKPLPEQFVTYVSDILHGNLGRSISTSESVAQQVAIALPNSVELVLFAMAFAVVVGISLGVLSAVCRDTVIDHAVRLFSVSGIAIPMFWFGLLLQLVFAVGLGWLPVSGRLGLVTTPPEPITHLLIVDALLRGQWSTAWEAFTFLLMPAFVLSFPTLASICRLTRAEMIETLSSDYVLGARAQGLGNYSIRIRHALRNAMLPVLAVIGLYYGWTLGGTALVETVFDWPGLGLLAVNSALMSDFKPVMAVTLIIGFNVMLANFIVDIAYAVLDPRLRRA
ncbi:MAG: ABC transporter permease [Rhizobiaceae bacterium]|jgi:peptide/nickel transport system permease protein